MKVQFLGLIAALGLASACASVPRPQQRFEASQQQLAAADAVDAKQNPKAALHLKLAQEEVDKAKALMDSGENERADYMLQRAQADAELAIAFAKSAPVLQKGLDTKEQLDKLKSQNDKATN